MSSILSDRKATLREKANNAMERLDKTENRLGDIEQNHARLAMAVNQVLNQAFSEVAQVKELAEGLVDILGDVLNTSVLAKNETNNSTFLDLLQDKLKHRFMKRQADDAAKVKAEVDKGVADGTYVTTEAAEEGCLLTGVEYDLNGVMTHPGYVAISWEKLKDQYKTELQGKTVGFKLTTDTGTFEVQQILKFAPKQTETVQA